MNWTEKDKLLFSIIHTFFRDQIGAQIQTSSERFTSLKERPSFFTIFGYSDLGKNEFIWINNMNTISCSHSKKYVSIFGSDETLKKLFEPRINFDTKYMNVIPYLMDLLNSNLSVIQFKSHNIIVYALVNLDVEKDTLNYEIFESSMFVYREYNSQDTYTTVKKISYTVKKDHKNKSMYECKEKLV